jgi:hypothetical protein
MALCESGAVAGSFSGSCIEDDLIYRYSPANQTDASIGATHNKHVVPDSTPQRMSYGASADEAHRFGLPCGGTREPAQLGSHSTQRSKAAELGGWGSRSIGPEHAVTPNSWGRRRPKGNPTE